MSILNTSLRETLSLFNKWENHRSSQMNKPSRSVYCIDLTVFSAHTWEGEYVDYKRVEEVLILSKAYLETEHEHPLADDTDKINTDRAISQLKYAIKVYGSAKKKFTPLFFSAMQINNMLGSIFNFLVSEEGDFNNTFLKQSQVQELSLFLDSSTLENIDFELFRNRVNELYDYFNSKFNVEIGAHRARKKELEKVYFKFETLLLLSSSSIAQ